MIASSAFGVESPVAVVAKHDAVPQPFAANERQKRLDVVREVDRGREVEVPAAATPTMKGKFVNAEDFRGLRVSDGLHRLVFGVADRPDDALIDTRLAAHLSVGSLPALLDQMLGAAARHLPIRLHVRQRLHERRPAITAFEPLYVSNDDDFLPESRGVPVFNLLVAVPVEPANNAAFQARVRNGVVRGGKPPHLPFHIVPDHGPGLQTQCVHYNGYPSFEVG